jgi:hypothetical protein
MGEVTDSPREVKTKWAFIKVTAEMKPFCFTPTCSLFSSAKVQETLALGLVFIFRYASCV